MSYSLNELQRIDDFIKSFYSAISLPKERKIDFQRLKAHFLENASILITNEDEFDMLSIDDFTDNYQRQITEGQLLLFEERELARRVEKVGRTVHVFSTYESHHKSVEGERIDLGLMSMQMLYVENQYRIVSLVWLVGTDDKSLPDDLKPGRM